MPVSLVRLTERPELLPRAAHWFHEKWGVSEEAYRESMEACLAGESAVPQWGIWRWTARRSQAAWA